MCHNGLIFQAFLECAIFRVMKTSLLIINWLFELVLTHVLLCVFQGKFGLHQEAWKRQRKFGLRQEALAYVRKLGREHFILSKE